MLLLKHRWRARGSLKPGEMHVGKPEWMKKRPKYKHVIDYGLGSPGRSFLCTKSSATYK